MRRVRCASRRAALLFAVLLVALSVLSCRPNKPKNVHPVSGQVLLDGRPVPGAMVVFHRVGETNPEAARPYGQTDPEGRFSVQTYLGGDAHVMNEGAPTGSYKVVVIEAPREAIGEEGEEDSPRKGRPARLPARYANPETSGLTVTVNEGRNELAPFELKRR
jgi:hypothetical protein